MKKYTGFIFIFLAALCFSTQEISGSYLSNMNLNSMQINSISYFIGALILLPFAIKDIRKLHLKLNKKDIFYFGFLGIIQVSIGMSLAQQALVYANPAIVAVIICANAIITVPLAQIILKEKMNPKAWISITLAIIGIIIISNPFSQTNSHPNQILGIFCAVGAAICIALFNVFATKYVHKYGKSVTNTISFLWGAILLFVFIGITGVPIIHGITLTSLPLLIYVGIVVKGLGFFFFVGAMKETSAITATATFYIKPIIVPILVFLIMGTIISPSTIIGTIIIIIASIIIFFIKKATAKQKLTVAKSH